METEDQLTQWLYLWMRDRIGWTAWLSFIGYLESGRSLKTVAGTVSKCPQQQYQICIDVSHKQADSVSRGQVRSSTDLTPLTTHVEDRLVCGMVHQWRSLTCCCAIRGKTSEHQYKARPLRARVVYQVFEEHNIEQMDP